MKKEKEYNLMKSLANSNVVSSGKHLDSIIFVGATGSLVLSITVVDVFGQNSLNTLPILIVSVAFFIVAIILHIISYYYSINYNKQVIKYLDKWRDRRFEGKFYLPKSKLKEYAGRNVLDFSSTIFVVLGIILLTTFVFVNLLNREVDMNNNINKQDISREKSANNVLTDIPDDSDQPIEITEEQVEEENSQDEPSKPEQSEPDKVEEE